MCCKIYEQPSDDQLRDSSKVLKDDFILMFVWLVMIACLGKKQMIKLLLCNRFWEASRKAETGRPKIKIAI